MPTLQFVPRFKSDANTLVCSPVLREDSKMAGLFLKKATLSGAAIKGSG
jgi:hypothetical protein